MPIKLTTEIKKKFLGLEGQMSPENLSCDGECSRSEQLRRYRQIMKEWRALEKEIGCKVEPDGKETLAWGREIYGY